MLSYLLLGLNKYDTFEYFRLKCYNGISLRLRIISVTIIYQEYFGAIAGNYISINIVKKYQHPPYTNSYTELSYMRMAKFLNKER